MPLECIHASPTTNNWKTVHVPMRETSLLHFQAERWKLGKAEVVVLDICMVGTSREVGNLP